MGEQNQKSHYRLTKLQASGPGRITRRIVDLLALLICVIILLNIGLKLSRWWRADDETVARIISIESVPEITQSEFWINTQSGPANVAHQFFTGSEAHVLKELTAHCQRHLASSNRKVPISEISSAEERLLKALQSQKPLSKKDNSWKIYSILGQWPTVIGILNISSPDAYSAESWRVAFWSIAIPFSQKQWRLWILEHLPPNDQLAEKPDQFHLPPDAKHVISLNTGKQKQLTLFSGTGPLDRWTLSFDQYYQDLKWNKIRDWEQTDGRQGVRFTSGLNCTPPKIVDITLYQTNKNQLTGICVYSQKR